MHPEGFNGRSPDIVVTLQVLFCPTNFLCRGEFGGWEGRRISSVEGMTGLSTGCPVGSGRSPGVSGGFYPERFGFSSTKFAWVTDIH